MNKKYNFHVAISYFKMWLLVFFAFSSMNPYFLWEAGVFKCSVALLLFSVQILQEVYGGYKECQKPDKRVYIILSSFLVYFVFTYIIYATTVKGLFISILLDFYPFFVLLLCRNDELRLFSHLFLNFIVCILLLSLIEYILILTKAVSLSPKIVYHGAYPYPFRNYGLVLIVVDAGSLLIPRFQSIFTEPGQLGTVLSLMLYAYEYKLKDKRVLILFISCVLTMSLAAFVLMFFGWLVYKFCGSKKKIIMLMTILLSIFVVYLGVFTYYSNNPDSILSKRIISRLLPDKEKGIQGNNRTTGKFDRAFSEQMEEIDENMIFGFGENALEERLGIQWGNSSYAVYIFKYGMMGILLLLIFYLNMCFVNSSLFVFGFLILVCLSFIQRPYAGWFVQMALMFFSSVKFHEKILNEKYNK